MINQSNHKPIYISLFFFYKSTKDNFAKPLPLPPFHPPLQYKPCFLQAELLNSHSSTKQNISYRPILPSFLHLHTRLHITLTPLLTFPNPQNIYQLPWVAVSCQKLQNNLAFHHIFYQDLMKNCIVKMVVKNKSKPAPNTNPQEAFPPDIPEDYSASQTLHNSKNTEEKENVSIQLKSLLSSFEKVLKEVSKPDRLHDIQPRDRKIKVELPEIQQGEKLSKKQLQVWITRLCNEVFSAAFHYFQRGNMSYDQAKIYCSENIISNIIRLNQNYHLTSEEIKNIDAHIEDGVTPYLLTKYPMTETQVVNKALEGEVKEIDNIQALENDIFFYSNDSYGFEFRESGNYNDLIMKLMNDLMRRIDEKENKVDTNSKVRTFYEDFYDYMMKAFENLESREWMENGTIQAQQQGKEDLVKKVEEQKYRARVKTYTSWVIGRKISQNVSQYTQAEISSMHMMIKSPAILRILTKWCQQLWTKFQKKNYFLDRTENVKCQKGMNVNTYFAWMKNIINSMIEQEKVEIQKFMDQIFKNNYDQQAIHCFRSLKGNYFNYVEKFQKAAGIFTVNIVNNLHSYILLYLNRLIHGLLKVSKRVYDKELIGRARWTSPPNLISFKIGDLMRCKIGSQEKEILKLFKHLSDVSEKSPQIFKIIRIKNRLKEGTNDILMNIRYKNVFICEAQLAVNSDHSNFIKCSNKYNHFIYEVKRSIFGPISELCSIWRSLDGRCKVYEKMANSKKQQISLLSLNDSCTKETHNMQRYNQPFVCSTCHQTYSHSNYIWPHQRCQKCTDYTLCCKCRIDQESDESLIEKLFNNLDVKKYCKRLKDNDEIPMYGICFAIQSKHLSMKKFVKLNIKGKTGLYYRKTPEDIDLITELNTKKEIQAFKDNFIIFQLPIDQGTKIVNISWIQAKNDFMLPKLVKSIYKKQKEFISLIGEEINNQTLKEILDSNSTNREKIKFLELPDNNISDVQFICKSFKNLDKLVLSRNRIKNIDMLAELINLKQLNIRDNLIEELPASLFGLFKLESLNIRNNKVNKIPEDISKLSNLAKLELNQLGLKELPASMAKMFKLEYIDLTKNKLGKVPEEIKELKRLYHLALGANGIEEIPEWIGELTELKVLELNKNKLKDLPESISSLTKLTDLQLQNNLFQALTFRCPQSLNVALFSNNKIKHISQNFFVKCKNLIKIELNDNQLVQLPKNIGVICPKMKNLSVNNNKIVDFHTFFGLFIPSLQLIQANHNQIKAFPKAFESCENLIELHLSDNPLQGNISEEFLDKSIKIEKLDFSKTKLTKIPDLTLAGTLKRLNFSETAISTENLEVLSGLQFVQELILQKMGLKSLPKALKQQHSLHYLDVKDNEISQFQDDFFKKLTHLRIMIFQNNKIKALPPSFKDCKRIKEINFSHNQIADFPAELFDFTSIEKIDLSYNKITRIVSDKALPSTITEINMSHNEVSEISESVFKKAEGLERLDFSNNCLKVVPRTLRDCVKLSKVNFTDNPIEFDLRDTAKQVLTMFVPITTDDDISSPKNDRESLLMSFLG